MKIKYVKAEKFVDGKTIIEMNRREAALFKAGMVTR